MWYPQVISGDQVINDQCQLDILVNTPQFSVFHPHVSSMEHVPDMSEMSDMYGYVIGETHQIL